MEAASISKCFEAGVMIHSGFCASNEPKFELARYIDECRDNEENSRSMFSEFLAGTAVKASGTDAQPDAAGSVLRGLGSFPNKQKIAFVSRKPCLQQRSGACEKSPLLIYLAKRVCYNFIMSFYSCKLWYE